MILTGYGWYWRRLKAMSASEILHRLKRIAQLQLERLRCHHPPQVPEPDLSRPSIRWLKLPRGLDPEPYREAADKVVQGRLKIFALKDAQLADPPLWNRDPLTGIEVPLTFGKTIDYRDPAQVGDIKYLWEVNRHLHFVTLAQAYRLTGREDYLRTLKAHIDSWLRACPYPLGPNWTSSLELGIRLINWAVVWQLLGLDSPLFAGDDGAALRDRWLTSIYRHAEFIRGHFSRYSSANNHLIGEAAGLFIASLTWPFWDRAAGWRESGWSKLRRESLRQNAPDGVNREQSTWYQQFVLDFLLIAGLSAKSADLDFPAAYWQRVERMMEFIAAVMDADGNVPMIGDADDGYVVRLAPGAGFSPFRSLLATGAVLFSRADLKAKAVRLDDKTVWLLGDSTASTFEGLPEDPRPSFRHAFPDGGYYVLGTQLEDRDEIRMVADAGPLGYLSIAAHGHADALSYTLSVNGEEFIIDSGTYAYHTNRRWRDYFRGTGAHNTIRVDGLDQSVIGGNFLWTSKASARCEEWKVEDEADRFLGWHDGYQRLSDPVLHRREIVLHKPERTILIIDTLECKAGHEIELFAHFAEHCRVTLREDDTVIARGLRSAAELRVYGNPLAIRVLSGDDVAPAGWISRGLDSKRPTTTVVWQTAIHRTTSITTEISCSTPGNQRIDRL